MKKILISTSLVSAFLFSGCSGNHALVNFKKDQFNANALQYTKKSDITVQNNPKVLFFATYLNSVEKKYDNDTENFLVGIYFVNGEGKDFKNNGYRLVLNDNEMLEEYTEIPADDEFVKNLPLKNPWAKYYMIKFDKVEDYKLKLKLLNENIGSTVINFEK